MVWRAGSTAKSLGRLRWWLAFALPDRFLGEEDRDDDEGGAKEERDPGNLHVCVLAGETPESIINEVLSKEERARSADWLAANRALSIGEIVGGFIALGSTEATIVAEAGGDAAADMDRARDAELNH